MSVRAYLQRQWQEDGWLARLLAPLSWAAARAVRRKRAGYLSGRSTAWRAPVPVVVVGNLYVGGTGKTPVVIAAVQGLRALGWTPGVISRGYGARIGDTPRVGQDDGRGQGLAPADYGDEPALIARATGAPVAVHPARALAAQALLRAHPAVDVIVSDDGLQHLRLARDVELVVQDERGLGNGRLLPAGPLREPPARLDEVDAVIINRGAGAAADTAGPAGASDASDASDAPDAPDVPGATDAPGAGMRAGPLRLSMHLEPGQARRLVDGQARPLASFAGGGPVAAAAGIGNPQRFFDTLNAAGIALAEQLPLPDHYAYDTSPFGGVRAGTILVTAKDAIKCRRLDDPRLWEVGVTARFAPVDLAAWLDGILRARGRKPGVKPDIDPGHDPDSRTGHGRAGNPD